MSKRWSSATAVDLILFHRHRRTALQTMEKIVIDSSKFPVHGLDREGPRVAYTSSLLDRADRNREDGRWLESHRHHPDTRYLPFWDLRVAMWRNPDPELYWCTVSDFTDWLAIDDTGVFLGIDDDGVACFATPIDEAAQRTLEAQNVGFVDARSAAAQLEDGRAAIVAQARSLLNWHSQNPFCTRCGSSTRAQMAGSQRACTDSDCGVVIFPRIDPVVIMLVVSADGEHCLLGRNPGYPGQLVSALAGYMEPGESIEEAVRRELLEEAGVSVGAVRYFTSQPWPFPATLMIGCFAMAENLELDVNLQELEWAQWFSKKEVVELFTGQDQEFSAPRSIAIAHHLIKHWLNHS
ncbi:MAG TPA: NAD(+) diphosphatase [Gammaproteobacteria bacterium]|nr:NAD(+) diphosphatase [Gammaproteobacteria bacterium]PHS06309.1 MAG: NAD(+) diphosphatase [Acidithiobacillus sp.]RTZ63175.1 MAG: NAD(+) diphosphatase [Gammaproteobacteria bacterium]HAD35679.1 NAD(+) diphosphatase [Gammaproteobacteria bacterium]HBK76338.1 NAD(+) diphosphatase [Gammaproteobacteria bacterium]